MKSFVVEDVKLKVKDDGREDMKTKVDQEVGRLQHAAIHRDLFLHTKQELTQKLKV